MVRFILLCVVLSLASLSAYAQVPTAPIVPGNLTTSWTLPTETECLADVTPCVRLPLAGDHALAAIQVFIATAPIADDYAGAPTLTLPASATAAAHSMDVPNGSTLYVRVKAQTVAGRLSKFSKQASKPIELSAPPEVPTNVTISIRIGT